MATLNTTANLTQITAPRVPLIDERTGLVSREWYRFFLSLYNLTGGGKNNTSLTDLQLGPPPAQQEDLTGLVINIESLKTQPNQESALEQISELEKQIQGLATAIGCACSEVAAELQKQIDALNILPLPNISASLTSGTSILYGNGSGGFSNVVIGSGVSFSGGTLSATGTGGTVTSVSGTGAVNGITLTGTVTSSGSLTLGGALSGIANAQLTNSAVTINGVSTSLGGSVSVGTVTNVAALNLGTTGTDLSSTVATSTTTPVITLNVPTASAANRGALSAADWTTFNSKQAAGTYVNSVGGTAPVVSSGGTAPVISLAANYGDTQNPYASKTANFVLAAPNGGAGNPTFRAIVAADIPTLNQNTTGNAATVTTNANLTGAVTSTGNATSLGSFTSAQLATALTDETGSGAAVFATSPTLVTPALGTPASGVVTNLTGTASININGTVGATTPAAGTFTTLTSTAGANFATSSGSVGIGTASPQSILHLKASAPTIRFEGENSTGAIDFFSTGFNTIASIRSDREGANVSGNLRFHTTPATGVSTERVRIDRNGNVGIGTASPAVRLDVAGTINSTGLAVTGEVSATGVTTLQAGTALLPALTTTGDTNTGVWFPEADTAAVSTGGTERIRIPTTGGLLVGCTSPPNASVEGFGINVTDGGGDLSIVCSGGAGTGGNRQIAFFNGNGMVGSIVTSGSATSYNTSSDYRLKDTVASMTGALAAVLTLKPVTYRWKVDGANGQGFIAHELAQVVPECVTGEKDALAANGEPIYQSIDTSFLVATLTAAIQEQQSLIKSLTTRLTALESKP